jgi:Flp pilus assembly protein TadG
MIRRLLRDESGGEIVENTITMGVFLLLTMGITQAGLIMWSFTGIQHGVQMAARCASVSDAAIAAGLDPATTGDNTPCYSTDSQGASNNASTVKTYAASNSWGMDPPSSTFSIGSVSCASTANTVQATNYNINLMKYLLSVTITPQSCYASPS